MAPPATSNAMVEGSGAGVGRNVLGSQRGLAAGVLRCRSSSFTYNADNGHEYEAYSANNRESHIRDSTHFLKRRLNVVVGARASLLCNEAPLSMATTENISSVTSRENSLRTSSHSVLCSWNLTTMLLATLFYGNRDSIFVCPDSRLRLVFAEEPLDVLSRPMKQAGISPGESTQPSEHLGHLPNLCEPLPGPLTGRDFA